MKFYVDWFLLLKAIAWPLLLLVLWAILDRTLCFIRKVAPATLKHFISKVSDERQREIMVRRTSTFHGLIFQVLRATIWVFFISMILWVFGVNLSPILAGVGVVGLGISLGAQNLFRDILNGFFIITEDQFNIGDWVEIGSHSGTVEAFSLRTTRIRSIEGQLVFIPNSLVMQVVNHNKEWAVARVEFGVPYTSRITEMIDTVKSIACEYQNIHSTVILDQPVVHGVVDFRPNDMQLRVLIKTVPGSQWEIGRGFRCFLKDRFDTLGIRIPLQQIVVHQGVDSTLKREGS